MRNYLISFVLMIAVYFIHKAGLDGAYMRYLWLDIVSHSLVCFAIATCIGALLQSVMPNMKYKRLIIITLTFVIGFSWEWLEVIYDITGHPLWTYEYYFDTTKDIVVDTLAATMASFAVFPPRKKMVTIEETVEIQSVRITNQ